MKRLLITLASLTVAGGAFAQQPPLHGEYNGVLGKLRVRVHISAGANGLLGCTLDSLDQGALGIACADFKTDAQSLAFAVPAVRGTWKGSFSQDGGTLSGTWNQGTPLALNLTRDTFVAAATPSRVDGYWIGTFKSAAGESYRLQMTLKSDAAGHEFCSIDNLNLHSFGTPCANVAFAGEQLSFVVDSRDDTWQGTLSADGRHLTGAVSGTQTTPLNFGREASLQGPLPPSQPRFDAALPPAAAADLQAMLAKDLEGALTGGALAPRTMAGVTIGVVRSGKRRVFAFGTAKPDSIYEIGSITKTFTGLVLAQMIAQGKVHLDDPVRTLLPKGAVPAPGGSEITLLDLVTQHSGLPRMPDNFHPVDPNNPYADYRPADLYDFLRLHGLQKPAEAGYLYSNLGVGLLGQALADRSGTTYAELVRREVLAPLELHDTTIALTPAQQARFIPGHAADHRVVHSWELDALAGAGAIRSTAADMLVYLNANMHPDQLPARAAKSREGRTLTGAIERSHELRSDGGPGMRIAFAWMFVDQSGVYWHDGATGGYSSFAVFNPKQDFAAVVLLNTAPGTGGDFADELGQHIVQRLSGQPAISLAPR